MIQFIVYSAQQAEIEKAAGTLKHPLQADFREKTIGIIQTITQILAKTNPKIVPIQDMILKHFGNTFQTLSVIFTDGDQLGNLVKDFLESIPDNEKRKMLKKNKLDIIKNVAKGDIFLNPDSRRYVLPKIISEIFYHFQGTSSEEKDVCITVIADMIDNLQSKALGGEEEVIIVSLDILSPLQTKDARST